MWKYYVRGTVLTVLLTVVLFFAFGMASRCESIDDDQLIGWYMVSWFFLIPLHAMCWIHKPSR